VRLLTTVLVLVTSPSHPKGTLITSIPFNGIGLFDVSVKVRYAGVEIK
jgi:hypothetical protein